MVRLKYLVIALATAALLDVISHDVSRRSLMPEGLIEGFTPQQGADPFN